MTDDIRFWCAVGTVEQLDFEGRVHIKDVPVGECHIVYSEVLLCRQSRDRLKAELKAKRQKTVQLRVEELKLCEKCEKKYKENPNLSWQKWVVSPPVNTNQPTLIPNPEAVQK